MRGPLQNSETTTGYHYLVIAGFCFGGPKINRKKDWNLWKSRLIRHLFPLNLRNLRIFGKNREKIERKQVHLLDLSAIFFGLAPKSISTVSANRTVRTL